MSILNIGWANRSLINLIFEADESLNAPVPVPSQEISQEAIISPMLKFIDNKMVAYKKKAAEEGKVARLTPYRDRSVYFLKFIKDNFPQFKNEKLNEIESSKKGAKVDTTGQSSDVENITFKKRVPSATEINWWFGNTLRSLPNATEVYKDVKTQLATKTDDKAIEEYINITSTMRGERYGIDPDKFISNDSLTTALATPLSAFKSPESKFEEDIPDERGTVDETKEFIIKALESFKSDKGDAYISDGIDDIINGLESITDPSELEDFITTQARKYNRIAQTEGEGGAKELYDILGDIIENFKHFKLYSAIKDVPGNTKIAPGSLQDIKDDVVYDIEDFIASKDTEYNQQFAKVIDKINDFKHVSEVVNYLKEKSVALAAHSNPAVVAYAGVLSKALKRIETKLAALEYNKGEIEKLDDEMKGAEKNQSRYENEKEVYESMNTDSKKDKITTKKEDVRVSGAKTNQIMIENYRKSLKQKIAAQIRMLPN